MKWLLARGDYGDSYVQKDLSLPTDYWAQFTIHLPVSTLTACNDSDLFGSSAYLFSLDTFNDEQFQLQDSSYPSGDWQLVSFYAGPRGSFSGGVDHVLKFHVYAYDSGTHECSVDVYLDATLLWTETGVSNELNGIRLGSMFPNGCLCEFYFFTDVRVGTTNGGTDIFADDFSSADTSAWSSTTGTLFFSDSPEGVGPGICPPAICWNIATDPAFSAPNVNGAVAYNGSTWVLVCGTDAGAVITSTDTVTWTAQTTPWDAHLLPADVIWCDTPGLFVMALLPDVTADGMGDPVAGGPIIATSPDGVTWTAQTTPWDAKFGAVFGLGWSHDLGQIVATGVGTIPRIGFTFPFYDGTVIMTSPDGVTWTEHSTPGDNDGTNNSSFSRAAWSSDLSLWVAVGSTNGPFNTQPSIMSSPDGATWTLRVNGPGIGGGTDVTWSHDLGLFVATAAFWPTGHAIASSPDGVTWTEITSPAALDSSGATGVKYSSDFDLIIVTELDGRVWATRDLDFWGDVYGGFQGLRLEAAAARVVVAGSVFGAITRILVGKPCFAGIHIWQRI